MLRRLSIASLLVLSVPAVAAPPVPASYGGRDDAAPSRFMVPTERFTPGLSGIPGSWESLLNPDAGQPGADICSHFRHDAPQNKARIPFDPEQIFSKLLDAGLCAEPSG